MRGFYLPKREIGFIVTHRSGSRLMLTTLKYFFDLANIEYEHIGYYNLQKYANKFKRNKFYILTRNPTDRFLSGYSWLKKNPDNRYEEYFENFKIANISDYVKNYKEICLKLPDAHFLPQTFGILSLKNDFSFTDFENLNHRIEFDEQFYHYKIIHIEDIDKKIKLDSRESDVFINNTDNLIIAYKATSILLFDDFYDLTEKERILFNHVYVYAKSFLEKNHHINDQITLELTDLLKVMEIHYNENIFFGYDFTSPEKVLIGPQKINLTLI